MRKSTCRSLHRSPLVAVNYSFLDSYSSKSRAYLKERYHSLPGGKSPLPLNKVVSTGGDGGSWASHSLSISALPLFSFLPLSHLFSFNLLFFLGVCFVVFIIDEIACKCLWGFFWGVFVADGHRDVSSCG